jgi:hypothetical protein
VEAPSSYSVLPLANFGTVTFSGAKATISTATGPIDNSTSASAVNQIDMVGGRSDAVIATTSALTDSAKAATSSFSVTYTGQSSTPTGGHHGGGHAPGRSTDQVIAFTNPVGAGNIAMVFAPQSTIPQYVPPAASRPVYLVDIGNGARPVTSYYAGDGNQQPLEDDGEAPGDKVPALATAPAQPQHSVLPPMGATKKVSADDSRWLAGVDRVFAQDFAVSQDGLVAQPVWTGLHEQGPKSLAGVLVLAGAVLVFQPQGEFSKNNRSDESKNRRLMAN